jgi:hypothetical protein
MLALVPPVGTSAALPGTGIGNCAGPVRTAGLIRCMGFIMYTRFVLICLLARMLVLAGEPPAMPMRAHYEDGAAFRWLNKKVLESQMLDDMEDLSAWTFHGQGDMALTTERVWHGGHALRLRAIPATAPPGSTGPAGSYGASPYWSEIEATRRVPGEDWNHFNRVSVWIYAEIEGVDAISFFMTLHNEGAEKLPDMSRREGYHFFILQNRAWNHIVWEIGPLSRDKVTAMDFSYWVPKTVAEPDDHVVFDLDQLELERVDADHYEGWDVAPGRIAFSHSGYPAGATKTAIASDLAASEFQLIRMDTGGVVLRKPVKHVTTRLGQYQVMDFSEVREPGTYALDAGGRATRSFQIGDGSWRGSIWKALNFLYVERCGFEIPGVHGVCHRDALLTHNGKQIVMNGGWHDAGDLSQGPVNTSNAVYGLLALAERMQARGEDPVLCRRVIEEAKWGLDWVLKTRFGDGFRATFIAIDSYTDGILGDFDDRHVEAQNNPNVNYLSAAVEARAWRVLKESDPERARRCLRTAQQDWEFAVKGPNRRRPGAYTGPDLELAAIGIIASTDLYQDTGEKRYADKAFELAEVVTGSQQQKLPDWKTPLAGFFYTDPRQDELYHASHVGNEQAPVVAMARLCEVFPNHPDWMRWYAVAALHSEYYLKAAARFTEPYGVLPASVYRESEAMQIPETGDGEITRQIFREQVRHAVPLGGDYFLRMFPIWTVRRGHFGVLLSQAKALAAAAHLRGDTEAADLAGKQVEWVLGRNPFSESAMYGEGYDFPPQYSERSGDIVGSLPVGIETRANNDEPYWPVQNCFNYKEVWVHPVARWFWLMQDVAGPALVEGATPAAKREPVEFRPLSGSEPAFVTPDFVTGRFRAWLPQGRYAVSQGGVHLTLALLPGGTYQVDLRPANAVDFRLTSEAGAGGVVTLRLTAEGAGRRSFSVRAFNLDVRDSEKTIVFEPGRTATLVWAARLKLRDVPWVVVAFPDGDLNQRQETTGVLPK